MPFLLQEPFSIWTAIACLVVAGMALTSTMVDRREIIRHCPRLMAPRSFWERDFGPFLYR